MTGRDRIVLIGIVVLAIFAGAWLLVVSPERQKASKLNTEVAAARTQLSSAEGQLATARTAQVQYAAAYASVVSLGKAVPPTQEVPSLIYQLSQASNEKSVQFASISTGSSSGASSSSASSAGASQAAAASAAFTQMPFTFVFEGSFFDLEHLFRTLTGFTTNTANGALEVSGRLLTIQSVKLAPKTAVSEAGKPGQAQLAGTITATAYVLPASQGLTGSASPGSPTGAAPIAATNGASSSPTPPAIARVNP
jgi:hypothetical protein